MEIIFERFVILLMYILFHPLGILYTVGIFLIPFVIWQEYYHEKKERIKYLEDTLNENKIKHH